MAVVVLDPVLWDADAILAQLQQAVQARDSWKDFFVGSTGETILEIQAGVAALNNYAAESALQEAMLLYAKNDSSVYAYTAGQGVRIGRKSPASCTATFTRTDNTLTQSIPAFSQFSARGVYLFNRETVVFPIGQLAVQAELHEGTVVSRSIQGIGEDFQSWISPEDGFQVSDLDVQVSVANVQIPVVTDGLWNYKDPTKDAAQDSTTPKGHLLLRFGNDLFGYKPLVSDVVDITYCTTNGYNGNDSDFSGTKFTFSTVQCVATTGLSGGYDEKPASLYRSTTPNLWGAHDTAVTGGQYHALACQYPGVRDVKFFAQRDLSVRDPRFMNLFKCVILADTPLTVQQKSDFEAWFAKRSMYSGKLFFEDPVPQPTAIEVDVYIRNTADPASIKAACQAAIAILFAPRYGYLQSNIYRSDIDAACYNVDDAVKFVRVRTPTGEVWVGTNPPTNVAVQSTLGVGALPTGDYNYAVTSLNVLGESSIGSYPFAHLSGMGSNTLSWEYAPNATGYKVYGRTTTNMGLLATLPQGTLSFTDDGGRQPGAASQLIDTSGVWYARLDSVTVNVFFSERIPFNQR